MPFTLLGPCDYREEIRKSRFIALATPVTSAAEAQAFITAHSDASASHNCWAWKVGQQYRSSDDGEPGGTAGRPILAAIDAQEMDQVAVLVIRFYGGIQLGTGGLAAPTAAAPTNACKPLLAASWLPVSLIAAIACLPNCPCSKRAWRSWTACWSTKPTTPPGPNCSLPSPRYGLLSCNG